MDRVGLAGLTLHETNVDGLERLRRILLDSSPTFARDLADDLAASEVVLITTCNRVELAYARESGDPPGPRDRKVLTRSLGLEGTPLADHLWVRSGREAVHHLLRVASSLDSLVVGEAQIQGQVREAFERARSLGLVGDALTPVFEAALQVGKRVRSETELSCHSVSVVSLGVQHLASRWAGSGHVPRVAVVGAGHMGKLVVRCLADAGMQLVLVANRSLPAAQELARGAGARAMDLATFRNEACGFDAIISATGAPGEVLDALELVALAQRCPGPLPLLAIDLAMPKDLGATTDPRIEVVNLDHLRGRAEENRAQRMQAALLAESIVERKLEALEAKRSNQRLAAIMADAMQETGELFESELARFLGGRMSHLGEAELRTIERWARTTFGRLAHAPVRAIKHLGHLGMDLDLMKEREA